MGGVIIKLIVDEKGQGAAEYILLFGGVIVIALIALQIYSSYLTWFNNPTLLIYYFYSINNKNNYLTTNRFRAACNIIRSLDCNKL